jgi:hypothetical protein
MNSHGWRGLVVEKPQEIVDALRPDQYVHGGEGQGDVLPAVSRDGDVGLFVRTPKSKSLKLLIWIIQPAAMSNSSSLSLAATLQATKRLPMSLVSTPIY